MSLLNLIYKKREGQELESEEIRDWVNSLGTKGSPPDYQNASLLAFIYAKGMSDREVSDLTLHMRDSGKKLNFKGFSKDLVVMDKHSTGGVGDKISLPLAPIVVAACERALIPMIAGRGLGHTGGTVDKLESIPGFQMPKTEAQFYKHLKKDRMVFAGQTKDIAPADKVLYALRDVTGTVPSIALITASILSKKLSESLHYLLLDVKFGSGAFMVAYEEAVRLAKSMQRVCKLQKVKSCVFLTNMSTPLGEWSGHRAEILESLEVLKGQGPSDTRILTLEFAKSMAGAGGVATAELEKKVLEAVSSGRAFDVFKSVVEAQGGSLLKLEKIMKSSKLKKTVLKVSRAGFLNWNVREVGMALLELGGGRKTLTDKIDFDVCFKKLVNSGQRVQKAQPVLEIYHRDRGLEGCLQRLKAAASISESGSVEPLIRQKIEEGI